MTTGGLIRHIADVTRTVEGLDHHLVIPRPTSALLASGGFYEGSVVEEIRLRGTRIHHVDMRRSPARLANALAVARLRRLVKQLRPDVVNGHSSIGGALARLACLGTGVPSVYTPNGLAERRVYQLVERSLGPLTARLIAVSNGEASEVRRLHLVPPDRVVTIPNGIDPEPQAPGADLRELLHIPPRAPLVATVVRLIPQKAPLEFVSVCTAVARCRPEVQFLLIGAGPLQADLDRAVAAAGLGDHWHQIPHLPDAASVLGQLDVFVLVSQFEGGPYAPLEAMRAGTPVVLSDVVGNRDVVEPGVSGELVGATDTEAARDAVIRLLDDRPYREALVEAARRRVRERFALADMTRAYAALYEEVAGGATQRRTRRLPQPSESSSANRPDRRASQ